MKLNADKIWLHFPKNLMCFYILNWFGKQIVWLKAGLERSLIGLENRLFGSQLILKTAHQANLHLD